MSKKIYDSNEVSPFNDNDNQLESAQTSNLTGMPIEKNFDYGNISKKDKQVVNEVLNNLHSELPLEQQIDVIKKKFQITEIPMTKLEDSIWYQMTKDYKLGATKQGLARRRDKDGNEYDVPHMSYSADLDYLDTVMEDLILKIRKMKFPE
jgi:hypothetical protein